MKTSEAQKIVNKIWRDVLQADLANTEEAAKANPEAYRACAVMERGKNTRHHYWESRKALNGQIVRWCYSKHRNVAGFYLTWIEIWKDSHGKRVSFRGWDTKSEAIEDCRRRFHDTAKPKSERRYTIPKAF